VLSEVPVFGGVKEVAVLEEVAAELVPVLASVRVLKCVDDFTVVSVTAVVLFLVFSVRCQRDRYIRRGQKWVSSEQRQVFGPTSLAGLETINVAHGTADRANFDAGAVGVNFIIFILFSVGGSAPHIPRRSVTH